MPSQTQYVTAAAVATAGLLGSAYCAYRLNRKAHTKLPEDSEWRQVGTLADLLAYPVKSCAYVALEQAECSILGLKDGWLVDRVLMLVNDKNNFVSARGHPELYLVKPTVKNSILTLEHPEMDTITVDLAEVAAMKNFRKCTIWGVEVNVLDCGWVAGEWLSRLIDKSSNSYSLVYYASQEPRPLGQFIGPFNYSKYDMGALGEEAPYHLINQASVDELNSRLTDAVTVRHFRPNFVLKGSAAAYDEDNWRFIKIGENVFEVLKPTHRCLITTVDPETGLRNPKFEPLKTLRSYRQYTDPAARKVAGNAPRMGLHIALRSAPGGTVALNDPIYVV